MATKEKLFNITTMNMGGSGSKSKQSKNIANRQESKDNIEPSAVQVSGGDLSNGEPNDIRDGKTKPTSRTETSGTGDGQIHGNGGTPTSNVHEPTAGGEPPSDNAASETHPANPINPINISERASLLNASINDAAVTLMQETQKNQDCINSFEETHTIIDNDSSGIIIGTTQFVDVTDIQTADYQQDYPSLKPEYLYMCLTDSNILFSSYHVKNIHPSDEEKLGLLKMLLKLLLEVQNKLSASYIVLGCDINLPMEKVVISDINKFDKPLLYSGINSKTYLESFNYFILSKYTGHTSGERLNNFVDFIQNTDVTVTQKTTNNKYLVDSKTHHIQSVNSDRVIFLRKNIFNSFQEGTLYKDTIDKLNKKNAKGLSPDRLSMCLATVKNTHIKVLFASYHGIQNPKPSNEEKLRFLKIWLQLLLRVQASKQAKHIVMGGDYNLELKYVNICDIPQFQPPKEYKLPSHRDRCVDYFILSKYIQLHTIEAVEFNKDVRQQIGLVSDEDLISVLDHVPVRIAISFPVEVPHAAEETVKKNDGDNASRDEHSKVDKITTEVSELTLEGTDATKQDID